MKALQLIVSLLLTLLLAACATKAPATPPTAADLYMYHTERNAQARMVTIYWINPPKSADLEKDTSDGDD